MRLALSAPAAVLAIAAAIVGPLPLGAAVVQGKTNFEHLGPEPSGADPAAAAAGGARRGSTAAAAAAWSDQLPEELAGSGAAPPGGGAALSVASGPAPGRGGGGGGEGVSLLQEDAFEVDYPAAATATAATASSVLDRDLVGGAGGGEEAAAAAGAPPRKSLVRRERAGAVHGGGAGGHGGGKQGNISGGFVSSLLANAGWFYSDSAGEAIKAAAGAPPSAAAATAPSAAAAASAAASAAFWGGGGLLEEAASGGADARDEAIATRPPAPRDLPLADQAGSVASPIVVAAAAPAASTWATFPLSGGFDVTVASGVALVLVCFVFAFAVTVLAIEFKRGKPGNAHGKTPLVSELEVQRLGACSSERRGEEGAAGTTSLREQVASLPVSALAELDGHLRRPASGAGAANCAPPPSPSKPLSSQQLLRLQACVVGPASGEPLRAPLSGQECVMFAALASRREPPGPSGLSAPASVPVASACEQLDFYVALQGSESDEQRTRVKVSGDEVMLFDMFWGKFSVLRCLSSAPEPLRSFVGAEHQVALIAGGGGDAAAGGGESTEELFEFEERALLLGTKVTIVGELVRHANGELSLRPLQGAAAAASVASPPEPGAGASSSAAPAAAAAGASPSDSAGAKAAGAGGAGGGGGGGGGRGGGKGDRLLPWERGKLAGSLLEEEQRRAEADAQAAAQVHARSVLISDDPILLSATSAGGVQGGCAAWAAAAAAAAAPAG